jgi:hypothetical protein
MVKGKTSDKKYLDLWEQYKENVSRASPINLNETEAQKKKRINNLEKNPEKWFAYYFASFYTSEPTAWHIAASKRAINNAEWFEVRSWSRELAKSARTMMEVLFLTLTGAKRNVLMVSSTYDNAERLLLPYKAQLELNPRIIADYGTQQSIGKWESGEFTTKKGAAFRALGAGQSPRGTRNDAYRPDVILIDDIDTDEECRSKKRIKAKVKWIMEALIPTRSISGALLLIACGNIIAKFCCITELAKLADKHEIVNIRGKDGKSTWPQKNSEAHIDRVLSMISWSAAQKEYFNNPISEGDTFKVIYYGKAPLLKTCEMVLGYADPSTSNKDKATGASKGASHKCVIVVGLKGMNYYIYWIRLAQTGQSKFVDWMFDAQEFMVTNGVDMPRVYIENNSLQDPMYKQVIQPLIREKQIEKNVHLSIIEDKRDKPDKFFRIEGTLEPLNRGEHLIFSEAIRTNPNMVVMEEQMLSVSEDATVMDGPDGLEGAVFLMKYRTARRNTTSRHGKRTSMRH